jgi:hypothetical protein
MQFQVCLVCLNEKGSRRMKKEPDQITMILQERGNRYGKFPEHARITQNIKAAMRDSPNWDKLPPYMKETLEMTAHKIGRILNGDPFYADSWVDNCGYNQLVVDELPKD